MKKHLFLQVDYHSTVKFSIYEMRQIQKWLLLSGCVLEYLFKKEIIKTKKLKKTHLSLLICGDRRIKNLNQSYRQKNKVTDVLSFPAHENLRKSTYKQEEIFLGDLAICFPQAKRQAKRFQIKPMDEFIHLFFHGLIHLLGYDHEISEDEKELMEKWENEALTRFGLLRKKTGGKAPS